MLKDSKALERRGKFPYSMSHPVKFVNPSGEVQTISYRLVELKRFVKTVA